MEKNKRELTVGEVISMLGYTPKALSEKLKTIDLKTDEGKKEWKKFLSSGFTPEERKGISDIYKEETNERLLLNFLPTKGGHSPLKSIAYRSFNSEQEVFDALEGDLPIPIGILGNPALFSDGFNLLELSEDSILFKKLHFKSIYQLKNYIERHREQLEKLQEHLSEQRDKEGSVKEIVIKPTDQRDWLRNEYQKYRNNFNTDVEWAEQTAIKFQRVFKTPEKPSGDSMKRYGIYKGRY